MGLDIGSYAVKLVEIDHGKKGRLLRNFGIAPIPMGAIVEGSVKNPESVAAAIKRLFKNLKVRNRNVAISLSGYAVIAKRIAMEKMDESEMEKAIQEEAEKYIPYDINEVNLDFVLLNAEEPSGEEATEDTDSEKKAASQVDVLLVAAKKEIVREHVELVQAAGLSPGVLDADAFALQNAAEISVDRPDGNYVIIALGAGELGINVVFKGVSAFSRDSSYGGASITETIMSEFKVDIEEAEKMKLGGKELSPDQRDLLSRIMSGEVSSWVKEIKRALDFILSTYPNETVDEIVLTGGSCRMGGLRALLEQETNLPVTYLNPFRNLITSNRLFDPDYLEFMAPQVGVAVGLALRSIDDK